jgi:WD40 repeat protein
MGVITVYDAKTGAVKSKYDKHDGTMVYTIVTSADGKTAYSGARDKDIHVWEVATGKEIRRLKGHTEQVYQLALSNDGKSLASASYDKSVRVWDLASNKEVKKFEGHTDGVQGCCFTPDARYVFSASWDKTIRKWRLPAFSTSAAKKVD